MRRRVWEPLAKHLEGVKVVLVSPDGPFNGLPLAALPVHTFTILSPLSHIRIIH